MIEQEYLNRWAEWHAIEKRDGANSESAKSAHFDALRAWRNLPGALHIQLGYRKLGPSHSEDDAREMAETEGVGCGFEIKAIAERKQRGRI
jgi:hypothetical protein